MPEKAKLFCPRQEGVGENTLSRFRAVGLLAAGAARPGFPVGKAPPFEKGRPPRHAAARGGRGTSQVSLTLNLLGQVSLTQNLLGRVSHPRNSQTTASASRLGKRKSYAWDATCVQAQLGGDNRTRTCDLLRVKQAL